MCRRIAPPSGRRLIDAGVRVALGSDFNPNAHTLTMPLVLNLACVTMRMTMNEALVAATINSAGACGGAGAGGVRAGRGRPHCARERCRVGAASLNIASRAGSIAVGKSADLVVVDSPHWCARAGQRCRQRRVARLGVGAAFTRAAAQGAHHL